MKGPELVRDGLCQLRLDNGGELTHEAFSSHLGGECHLQQKVLDPLFLGKADLMVRAADLERPTCDVRSAETNTVASWDFSPRGFRWLSRP